MDQFDPEYLRLDSQRVPKPQPSERPPKHRHGELFIKGPIPVKWLRPAIVHPTAAIATWVLWYLAGRSDSREVVPTHAVWQCFGISPRKGNRGIDALAHAGLVQVVRRRGRCPVVTLMDAEEV